MSANSKNKEEAYNGIKELVEKFKSNYKQFHSSDYNETLTRQDFINPFFEYLGWDISNKEGLSQTYRDVIHEDKLKIGKETKAPDYSFRIGGNRVFFVEAKKPNRNLKEDSDAAYQIRRYAWSGKLAVSILTDFEEFAIYDCSKKPSPNDKASMSRIEYINYEDYLNRFDFLYDTFAKENVLRGSLEKYNADTKSKKGTESVDIDFLNSLDDLRTKLASNISKLNSLSLRDLNFAVQHIIDRIIFLRVAEDRGVENYGDLREACFGNNYYKNIVEIFKKADGKYNSGIFDFSKDKITQNIEVDNKVIKEIINDLYYPKSPYEFSVISVEIIGNAYEQFLGKTITIGKNNASRRDAFGESGQMPKAKIELKPEVRKAGGVYYTPEYIVDYIVENTVGEKIKGKTPKEIANIKIVDPACGSGSFLLGAYKYLLNYHIEYYSKIKDRAKFKGVKEDVIKENGDLTIWIKKQILRNNIFGVDIDSNAVEVTKLSLLMKCLEGESPASIQNNQDLFNERALPSLEDNIKCGNSLIGNDFYESQSMLDFDEETQYKINCFDWEDEFKNVFKGGGFDIVIGNPPWGADILKITRSYLTNKYKYVVDYQSYQYFLFMLFNSLKENGLYGMIIPNTFSLNVLAKKSRDNFLNMGHLMQIVDLSNIDVFIGPKVRSTIFIGCKSNLENTDCKILFMNNDKEYILKHNVSYNEIKEAETWKIYLDDHNELTKLFDKIVSNCKTLSDYCNVKQGYIPYRTTTLTKRFGEQKAKDIVKNRLWHSNIKESEDYQKELQGSDVKRYALNWSGVYVKYGKWVSTYLPLEVFSGERLLIREISGKSPYTLFAMYTDEVYVHNPSVLAVLPINKDISMKFILGLLNSRLIGEIFLYIAPKSKKGLFPKIIITDAKRLPIPNIDLNNKQDKEMHDKIVTLVDNIITLNKKLSVEKNPNSITIINRQINAVDKQIDSLVYKLYNLNDEEVKIIEGE